MRYDNQAISVFLENKNGRINDVTKTLAKYDINMHAFSMAESTDFGILRLIVSDVEKAVEVLRAENFAVMLTDVVCISCPNVAGSLAKVLDYLAAENIFIEYMYAFAQGDTAHVVIRPSNVERCVEILNKFNCNVLTRTVCNEFDFVGMNASQVFLPQVTWVHTDV